MTYLPIPTNSILHDYEYLGIKNGEKRWRSHDGKRLYTWDGLHGEIEVFNKRGKHFGAADPFTGILIKPEKKGRKIDV